MGAFKAGRDTVSSGFFVGAFCGWASGPTGMKYRYWAVRWAGTLDERGGATVITYCKMVKGTMQRVVGPEWGCWADVVAPSDGERRILLEEMGIVPEFLRSALDEEESAHIDIDEDAHQRMVIVDCPVVDDGTQPDDPETVQYKTQPLAVIFLQDKGMAVSIGLHPNPMVASVVGEGKHPDGEGGLTRLFLQVLLKAAQLYPGYLNGIVRQYVRTDGRLRRSMSNAELINLLDIQKSLVYFSTSLGSEKPVLDRLASGKVVELDDEDREVLNDVVVEIAQATEMCRIYTDIVANTMGAYGNVISNNLNSVMKALAIITVIMTIPNIVFGFYGMNTAWLPLSSSWAYPLAIATVACAATLFVCIKAKVFK